MDLRNKYLLFSVLAAAMLVVLSLWNVGQTENDAKILYFSREPGFYDTAFDLEILSDVGTEIFYTLDGSDPSRDAIPYTGPIWITDPSSEEDRYASRTDVSTGFLVEKIKQLMEEEPEYPQALPEYVVPERVDKCTILRAAVYDGNMELGSITGSYFVGMQEKESYDGFTLVSLVTDPDNLFDYDTGIYVTGAEFDAISSDISVETGIYWNFWNANYTQRGREYERPAHIEIFGENRELLLDSNCGIRIHGNASRSLLPKSLRVYARREYCGSETFASSPIPGGVGLPHKFLLYACGNDNIYMMKDAMMDAFCADLQVATMDMHPCMVFLDGEFWGCSYIAEVYDSKYIYDHYGIPEESVVIVKEGALSEGEESDLAKYQNMVEFISTQDMTIEENYREAEKLIDMENYANYFAIQIYIARHGDWPDLNYAAWRAKVSPAGEGYRDGRWRWMLLDANSPGMSSGYAEMDTLEMAISLDPMFASLCRNAEFKQLLSSRLKYMAAEVFSPEKCSRYMESYRKKMLPAVQANSMRFYGRGRINSIQRYILNIQMFFDKRPDFVDTMIKNNLGEEYL